MSGTVKNTIEYTADLIGYVTGKEFDVPLAMQKIKEIMKNYDESMKNNSWDGVKSYTRGLIRSQWLNEEDASIVKIRGIDPGLDATEWVYIIGNKGNSVAPKGLYWTAEDLNSQTYTGGEYSNECVLSYCYNETTNKYEVIANRVWLSQGDLGNNVALSAQHDWNSKPKATVIGSYDTYADAQEVYAAAKAANGGSFVFANQAVAEQVKTQVNQ